MAHPEQIKWCKEIRKEYPQYFKDCRVIDIGSLDINGNNRGLFRDCEYIGVDIVPGKNVDVVCMAHELEFEDESFDVVISTNTLEHDIYYPWTLKKMVALLKPNGLIFISASYSHKEHGTFSTTPDHSGTAQEDTAWAYYYKNITQKDIETSVDSAQFKEYTIQIADDDIRFWGVKNG